MKNWLLFIIIFITQIVGFSQNNSINNSDSQQLHSFQSLSKNDTKLKSSKFSFGITPFSLFEFDEPTTNSRPRITVGLGIELNVSFLISDNFLFKGFLRFSNIFNGPNMSGSSGSLYEKAFENYIGTGGIFEYKIYNRLGFNIRVGREVVNIQNKSGNIYGGGISVYLKPSESKKTIQSFNLTVYKSNNHSTPQWDENYKQITTFYEAIIYRLGWNIQFHWSKN